MQPILPLVTHMSLTCQYGNYTSSRMTFIRRDLTMGSIKTNATCSPAFFLPHSMLGSLLLLIFFFAPLGSLFTGYHDDLFPFTTCSFFLIDNRAELQTPYFISLSLIYYFCFLPPGTQLLSIVIISQD